MTCSGVFFWTNWTFSHARTCAHVGVSSGCLSGAEFSGHVVRPRLHLVSLTSYRFGRESRILLS